MTRKTKRILLLLVLAGLVAIPAGLAIIIFPDNPLVRLYRSPLNIASGSKLLTGPYPMENDFKTLRGEGVTTVVSLLNPAIYYESVLLDRERAMAEKYGMRLLNFPMSSILGQRFGSEYDVSSKGAAEAIMAAEGRVYLHCYLGLHRAQAVFQRLKGQPGMEGLAQVNLRESDRSASALATDAAEAAYHRADYRTALEQLDASQLDTVDVSQLRGWSLYKLRRYDTAVSAFTHTLELAPGHPDALVGRAYAWMQAGKLDQAQRGFEEATRVKKDSAEAWAGLGITLFRAGKAAEARRALRKALQLEPGHADAKATLARLR